MSPHVLVLHFERLKQRGEERTAELQRVLKHLGLDGDEEMQARAECLGEVEVGGHHKRQGRPRLPEDAFTDDIRKR